MISRGKEVDNAPESTKSKFKRTHEGKDHLSDLLPFAPGCLKTLGNELRVEKSKKEQFSRTELTDFRVPMDIFMSNAKVLMPTKPPIRLMCLKAVGIDTNAKTVPKVDWDIFLRLNKLIKIGGLDKKEYIDYFVKFFNPIAGQVSGKAFEE